MAQDRLLDIAIREFGAKGLDGAGTRAIAQAAGTAMSAITYHYGGKAGLYLAAAEHIAEQMAAQLAPVLVAEREIAADDDAGARAAIHRIVSRFADKLSSDDNAGWAPFILREQMAPTEAFDRIYAGLMGQIVERVATLVRIATGRPDERAARITTFTIMAQVIALRGSRATLLRLLDRPVLDAPLIDDLKARIAANIDAILDRMVAERQEPA